MGYVDAGQGNMVYVPDPYADTPTQSGNFSPPPPTFPTVTNPYYSGGPTPPDTPTKASFNANVNPALAAAASQEDRGGVAGAQTATLLALAKMQADIEWLKAVVAKLIT